MTGPDVVAFLVMGVIVAAIAVAAIIPGGLPGKIAAGRIIRRWKPSCGQADKAG